MGLSRMAFDAAFPEQASYRIDGSRSRGHRTNADTGGKLALFGNGAEDNELRRSSAKHTQMSERLSHPGIVGRQSKKSMASTQIVFAEDAQGAAWHFRMHRVDEHDQVPAVQVRREVQTGGAEIHHFHIRTTFVRATKQFDSERTKAIIAQQNVSDSSHRASLWRIRDGSSIHCTFTCAISRPVTSRVWQEHAMQGSKECTVRSTSSGFSGSATGVPTSELSYGPGMPA